MFKLREVYAQSGTGGGGGASGKKKIGGNMKSQPKTKKSVGGNMKSQAPTAKRKSNTIGGNM